MKNRLFSAFLLLLAAATLHTQAVSINTDASNPDPSAILDVKSTDKGMLVPRMSTAQRTAIAAPATGLLVFDTNTGGFWFFNGTVWADLSVAHQLADTDKDTKIQVEENPDEDIVRVDLAGSERLVLKRNAGLKTMLEFPNNSNNLFLGTGAGNDNTTGANNTANGYRALFSNTTGDYNTAHGYRALDANTSGDVNTATGAFALYSNNTGWRNTAIGGYALYNNTVRSGLVAVGYNALFNNGLDATISYHATSNTAVGYQALYSNTTGYNNTANGYEALLYNTIGYSNTAMGNAALLYNTTGYANAAIGSLALYNNTTGYHNTAIGPYALLENTMGASNVALGYSAGYANETGNFNTYVGSSNYFTTLNGSGSLNTSVGGWNGYSYLDNSPLGSENTFFGFNVGNRSMQSNKLTLIGASANLQNSSSTIERATALGYNAQVNCSNCLVLGGTGPDFVNVGIGTTTPTERLEVATGNVYATTGDLYAGANSGVINAGGGIMNPNVNIIADANPTLNNANGDEDLYIGDDLELGGQGYKPGGGAWATASDARLKKDVAPYTDGLAQVLQIKPVRYRYNNVVPFHDGGKTYVGVLAQDIARVAPYMVELTPFGQKVTEDEHGNESITDPGTLYYTYDGTALTYMLVNAVQEQQALIETQQAENTALKTEINGLKNQLREITAALQTAGIGVNRE